tara:strand:+ start:498 stop:710 length:213 start_codon:yes stop_codon:yes gene_type:complete
VIEFQNKKTNIVELLSKRVDSLESWEREFYVTKAEFELYLKFLNPNDCKESIKLFLDGKQLIIQDLPPEN